MRMKKALLAALCAGAAALTACGGQDVLDINRNIAISFSWWGKDVRHSYTISAVKDFALQNPDIDVITRYGEFEAFQDKMYVTFAAHKECDVMQINYDWLYRFSPDGNGFYDLNELSGYIDFSTFTEDELSYGMVNGKLNAISNALNCETCYYNKEIYDKYGLELPSDWEDLFEAAKIMSKDGVYPLELSRKAAWMLCIAYEEQHSGKHCYEGQEVGFTTEQFKDMICFYKRLVDEKVTKYHQDIGRYDFQNGAAAGTVCWISDAGYYCQPLIDAGMDIVVGNYLRLPASELSGWYAKPTSMYCIKRDTANPEAAAKLVDYLVNSHNMAKYQGLEKGIPLSSAMLEVLEANDQLSGIQNDANELLANTPSVGRVSPYLENVDLISAFDDAVQNVLYNGGNPEENAAMIYEAACKVPEI